MRQSVPVSRILRETNVPLIRYRPAPRSSSPFNRNHRPPLPPASAAPEPPFEVENLGAGAQSDPQQRLRRKQRDVMAGGGIDLDEGTRPEGLHPRGVKGRRSRPPGRPSIFAREQAGQ